MSVTTPKPQYKFSEIKRCLFPAALVFLVVMWTVFPCELFRFISLKSRTLSHFIFVVCVLLYILLLGAAFAVLVFFPGVPPLLYKIATAFCITCLVSSYVFTVRMLANNPV